MSGDAELPEEAVFLTFDPLPSVTVIFGFFGELDAIVVALLFGLTRERRSLLGLAAVSRRARFLSRMHIGCLAFAVSLPLRGLAFGVLDGSAAASRPHCACFRH